MSGEKFPIDTAQIVGLFMESVAYGVYLPTFFLCMWALLREEGQWKRWRQLSHVMLIAALLMFLFATMDVGFGLYNNIMAFVTIADTGVEPEETFDDLSHWTNVMKMVNYVGMTFVGDAILVYRCYVIWERRWLIVLLPAVLYLGEAACGVTVIYFEAAIGTGALSQHRLQPYITSMLSMNLATNLITTGLIVYRIWRVQHNAAAFIRSSMGKGKDPMTRAIRAMIESGAVYTLSIVILFIVYMLGNNALLGVSDVVTQIIGINFNLIIINTSRARKEMSSGQVALSGPGAVNTANSMPMHMISIRTEVSRQPDPIEFDRNDKAQDVDLERSPSPISSVEPPPKRQSMGRTQYKGW